MLRGGAAEESRDYLLEKFGELEPGGLKRLTSFASIGVQPASSISWMRWPSGSAKVRNRLKPVSVTV